MGFYYYVSFSYQQLCSDTWSHGFTVIESQYPTEWLLKKLEESIPNGVTYVINYSEKINREQYYGFKEYLV